MNLRPEIKLSATKKSASSLSCSSRFDAKRKLVLISAITELPVGRRNVGQTKSLIDGNPYLNCSIVFFKSLDSALDGVFSDVVPFYSSSCVLLTNSVN